MATRTQIEDQTTVTASGSTSTSDPVVVDNIDFTVEYTTQQQW